MQLFTASLVVPTLVTTLLLIHIDPLFSQSKQQVRLDSLERELPRASPDTNRVKLLTELSKTSYELGMLDKTIEYGEMALSSARDLQWRNGEASAHLCLGNGYKDHGKYDEALTHLTEALSQFSTESDELGIASTHHNIGNIYRRQGNFPQALKHLHAALESNRRRNDKRRTAAALHSIATINSSKGDYSEALTFYSEALSLMNEIDDRSGMANIHMGIGATYHDQGNYPVALEHHMKALVLMEAIGNRNGVANCYGNIANVHRRQGEFSEALNNNYEVRRIKDQIGDRPGSAQATFNIGNIHLDQGHLEEALNEYKVALKQKEVLNDQFGISVVNNAIGRVLSRQGRSEEALNYLLKALKGAEAVGDKAGQAGSSINIGDEFLRLGRQAEAKHWLLKGLNIANKIRHKLHIKHAREVLASVEEQLGNENSAYTHYKEFIAYRDSLRNEENTKELVRTRMQYEFDKKEAVTKAEQDKKDALAAEHLRRRELQRNASLGGGLLILSGGLLAFRLHRKRNRERFEKETALLENKALRAQMNPHFIGNAMQSIKSYMNTSEADRAGDLLVKFDRIMRRTLKNSAKKEVTLEEDLNVLRAYLEFEQERTQNRFQYRMEVAPELLQREPMIPPLLIQPFLENAIEHGILPLPPDVDGLLELVIHEQDGSLLISIKDNGVGRNHKTSQVEPTNDERGSMSTDITKARLALIEREKNRKTAMRIVDLPQGTEVVIELPLDLAA